MGHKKCNTELYLPQDFCNCAVHSPAVGRGHAQQQSHTGHLVPLPQVVVERRPSQRFLLCAGGVRMGTMEIQIEYAANLH